MGLIGVQLRRVYIYLTQDVNTDIGCTTCTTRNKANAEHSASLRRDIQKEKDLSRARGMSGNSTSRSDSEGSSTERDAPIEDATATGPPLLARGPSCPQSPLQMPTESSTNFSKAPYKHGGLLSDQPAVRSKEAANHLLNALGEGRPELVTAGILEQLSPDGAQTKLVSGVLGWYDFGGHKFSAHLADQGALVVLQAAVLAAPFPTVPLIVGVPSLLRAVLDPAVRRDSEERFIQKYEFAKTELLDHQAGAGSYRRLEHGDTIIEMSLKVCWPGRWLQEQKDRATATLLRRVISEGMQKQGMPLRVQVVWLCNAIARTRKSLMPDGVTASSANLEDRNRVEVAITVLEEDMLHASPPFAALYSDRVASKLVRSGGVDAPHQAKLLAKLAVIEHFGQGLKTDAPREHVDNNNNNNNNNSVRPEETSATGTTSANSSRNSSWGKTESTAGQKVSWGKSQSWSKSQTAPLNSPQAIAMEKAWATKRADELSVMADELNQTMAPLPPAVVDIS